MCCPIVYVFYGICSYSPVKELEPFIALQVLFMLAFLTWSPCAWPVPWVCLKVVVWGVLLNLTGPSEAPCFRLLIFSGYLVLHDPVEIRWFNFAFLSCWWFAATPLPPLLLLIACCCLCCLSTASFTFSCSLPHRMWSYTAYKCLLPVYSLPLYFILFLMNPSFHFCSQSN